MPWRFLQSPLVPFCNLSIHIFLCFPSLWLVFSFLYKRLCHSWPHEISSEVKSPIMSRRVSFKRCLSTSVYQGSILSTLLFQFILMIFLNQSAMLKYYFFRLWHVFHRYRHKIEQSLLIFLTDQFELINNAGHTEMASQCWKTQISTFHWIYKNNSHIIFNVINVLLMLLFINNILLILPFFYLFS